MEKSTKRRWYSVFYIICLVLFFSNIPFNLFINNEYLLFSLSLTLEIVAIIVFIFQVRKEKLYHKNYGNYKKSIIFIPTLLICFTNYIVVSINKSNLIDSIETSDLIFSIVLTIFNVLVEELLFRYLLQYEFEKKTTRFKAILYSSLIFGAIHLLNISSIESIPICLLQAFYTFGLGLVLGVIYSYTKNLIFPIILHLLFNINNDILVTAFFDLKWDYVFFIVNIGISLIIGVYLLIIYRKFMKGDDDIVT